MTRNLFFPFICLLFILASGCNKNVQYLTGNVTQNARSVRDTPYLILISLDGYRWDYTERFNPPNLSGFINEGVAAASMIPSFPSKTFPNHYTVATGMYPGNHGIINNSFYNYEKEKVYKISNREVVRDGSWYKGTPIWVQAANAGMVTASFFFVGSEADVKGIRPGYFYYYDGNIKNGQRVQQALDWLSLPAKNRPHFISMYFSDMDDIGHSVGPHNDPELKSTLMTLDEELGVLFEGVKATGLPVNIIIVSDHGMKGIPTDRYLPVESIENDDLYRTVNNGAVAQIYPYDNRLVDSIILSLESKENHYKVYRTEDVPHFDITPKDKNYGPVMVVPDIGWYFTSQRNIGFKKRMNKKMSGEHGMDVNLKEMHGIFYANGPGIKQGLTIPSMKNIHVYPLMCKLLGLEIPGDIDGDVKVLEEVLEVGNEN